MAEREETDLDIFFRKESPDWVDSLAVGVPGGVVILWLMNICCFFLLLQMASFG